MIQANLFVRLLYGVAVLPFLFTLTAGQDTVSPQREEIVRTKSISRTMKFGPGGNISLIGAPHGSVSVEGWAKNQVSVSAEIEVHGKSEEDAARIAKVTGFYVEEDVTSLRIYSVGPHNKKYLKQVDKKFPKNLRNNRFSINYKIFVPEFSDLRIDGGRGDFELRGIEGAFAINYVESNALLRLVGGSVQVIIGKGNVDVTIAARSWRGRSADIQVADGNIDLRLPKNLNADLSLKILRAGRIANGYTSLEPKPRTEFSDTFMDAIAGSGGAKLSFTIGDGNLTIHDFEKPAR